MFSHALIHPCSDLAPPEKAVLTIFFDTARKRKWRRGTSRLFYEMYVVRELALEMSDLGSTGGQNNPKTAISLKCRGDVGGEVLGEGLASAEASMQKNHGMCRGRERMEVLIGKIWVRTMPVLPPGAPNLLQLPACKSTGLIMPAAERG